MLAIRVNRCLQAAAAAKHRLKCTSSQKVSATFGANIFQERWFHGNVTAKEEDRPLNPIYIHHISKIVLQHLQDFKSEFLVQQGLNHGLYINSNGTFVLNFPARKGFDSGRIWTSYDTVTKQHWLSVYRKGLNGRFLLKDHVDNDGLDVAKRIEKSKAEVITAVEQMVARIMEVDNKKLK